MTTPTFLAQIVTAADLCRVAAAVETMTESSIFDRDRVDQLAGNASPSGRFVLLTEDNISVMNTPYTLRQFLAIERNRKRALALRNARRVRRTSRRGRRVRCRTRLTRAGPEDGPPPPRAGGDNAAPGAP